MDYNTIINYFGFQSFSINNGKGGMREEFSISGKGRKGNIGIFLLFSLAFLPLYLAFCMDRPKIYYVITVIIFLLTLVALFIRHKLLYLRLEKKEKQINIYQREKPSNLRPAHVRMLLKDGLVDELSVASTIADLIDRKYLEIEGVERVNNLFKPDANITLKRTEKSDNDLLAFEKYLIDWFINICGDGKTISSKQLREVLASKNEVASNDYFTKFKGYVLVSFPLHSFYKTRNNSKEKIVYLVALLSGFISFVISPFTIFLPVYGLGSLLFNCPPYVLNKSGQLEINNWKALKKFLIDFSNIEDKSTEMIAIWEFYLPYSIILGVNKTAKDEIFDFFSSNINKGSNGNGTNLSEEQVRAIGEVQNATSVGEAIKVGKEFFEGAREKVKDLEEREKAIYQFKQNL